ncbi:hypothetical protein TRFO_28018 [Tritrichomonas foetus]|uniref:RSE1/DDB1/CPSF1 first beta-propeller domain-containing protein n=1 Tax=Tritrichomonas foetus TaxID=1144522 RepID=A0A1J4JZB8_9EUKA|nr:hypothetical protein TRFO_28018 [Tritrichomonas foetus]|eukprot:OHT04505.1 hypothetical protein TRFO_28018 [Tritrichomonas foetus]
MEDFFISEVFPASSITDATIITSFFEENDALAVARGNRLVIYRIEDQFLQDERILELYGEILKLIPIQYSHTSQGNLLIILGDLQVCILSADQDEPTIIKTLATGTLAGTCDAPLPPIKHVLHPFAIVLQLSNSRLDVFPITSNSTLDVPFQIEIGCKRIIDFHFIGPTSKVTRLAVLTEEFNKSPTLRMIEIDSTNKTFNEDPEKNVTGLPMDTYLLIPYDPENQAIIVAFSAQQAIRVLYNNLTPKTTTATIFTTVPLITMIAMKPDFYMAIDSSRNLKLVKLGEEGNVHFIDVAKCPQPSAVAAISCNLAFIGSEKDDSKIYTIEEGTNSSSATVFDTIRATGPCLKFYQDGNRIISIFQRAFIDSALAIELKNSLKISCAGFSRVFPFVYDSKDMTCYLLSSSTETKILAQTIDGEFIDFVESGFIYCYSTIGFYQINTVNEESPKYLQITEHQIVLLSTENNSLNIISSVDFQESLIKSTLHGKTLLIATHNNLHIFDIADTLNKRTFNIPIEGGITAIALNNHYLAYATSSPNTVLILFFETNSIIRKYDFDIVVDLIFEFDKLYALDLMEKVHIIDFQNSEIDEIQNQGFNTFFSKLNNNQLLICGENPFILNKKNQYFPLTTGHNECSSFIDATFFENQLISLDSEYLSIGSLSMPKFISNSYYSEMPLIDMFYFYKRYFTVRKITANTLAVFASKKKYDKENISPFYIFKPDEKYTGYYTENDNLFLASNYRVFRFIVHAGSIDFLGEKSFGNDQSTQIKKFGTFRDYSYAQFENQIDFYTAEVSNQHGCELYQMFSLKNDKIVSFDCNNQLAAVINGGKLVIVYSFDDYMERFLPIPPYQSSVNVTSVAVSRTKIICGTENGNVLILGSVCSFNSTSSEQVVQVGFSIGEKITAITTMPNQDIMIGTEKGMVMALKRMQHHDKFQSGYDILSTKLTSIGRFKKRLQRSPKQGRYLLPGKEVYDLDLINRFYHLPTDEQEKLVKNSKMTLNDLKQYVLL